MSRMLGSLLCLVVVGLPMVMSDSTKEPNGKIWAVLVAGSSGYRNYRHQADVCHAYQIFHRHGVPDSQIIVMMYDDIAQNPLNPKKGKIFNKPQGPNVYVNVPKDYTGKDVTPENFMHVLTGNSSAVKGIGSGKVLKSGPNDHVFVNFVDHGAPGFIVFPRTTLYADDLQRTLLTMYQQQMYNKLVFYLEACESGSMFENVLPTNISVFATTAATPRQSSFACYFDKSLHTYLGDEYSIAWMEDIDSEEHHSNLTTETLLQQYRDVKARVKQSQPQMYGEEEHHSNLTTETLLQQYRDVKARVKQSQPQMYGEVDIEDDHVTDFMGNGDDQTFVTNLNRNRSDPCTDAVSSRDVALAILDNKILLTNDIIERGKLQRKRGALIKARKMVDQLFERVIFRIALQTNSVQNELMQTQSSITLDMMPCYRTLVDNFSKTCLNINKNTYTLGHMYKLANLCSLQELKVEDVLQVFAEECSESFQALSGIE